jgi:radical SAM superfamily enzyme YgiQ (UPF0313 family)
VPVLRRELPDALLVTGGPLAGNLPEYFLDLGANVVVKGAGESTFPRILREADCLRGSQTVIPGDAPVVPAARLSPVFELFDMASSISSWQPTPGATVVTAYGCVYACSYCQNFLGRYVPRNSTDVKCDLIALKQLGAKLIFVGDALIPIPRARELSDVMADVGLNWTCMTRSDMITSEIAGRMADSGCQKVFIGLESAGLSETERGRNKGPDQTRKAGDILRSAGIEVRAFVLFGLPGETPGTINATMRLLDDLGVYGAPNILMPLPGTPIWEMAVRRGAIPDLTAYLESMTQYGANNREYAAVTLNDGVTKTDLAEAVHRVWEHNNRLDSRCADD